MSRYSATSPIFANEEALREEHHPDTLPERQDEMDALNDSLSPAARGAGANNVFIHGKAGQGKTAAVKAELSELQYHAEQESEHLDLTTCYISCESHDLSTSYKAASRIYQQLTGADRPTGYSTDVVMDMMFEAMDDIGGTIILVLDEIDALGDDDRLLYSLSRARAQGHVGEHVYPSVIGISNDLQWRDSLSPKVKSSLYDDSILFSPYNAGELQQILRRRAAKAFRDTTHTTVSAISQGANPHEVAENNGAEDADFQSDVLDDGVIELIAAMSAQDKGDARQAIKYLRKAGEVADREDSETVSQLHAREAETVIERETVVEAMRQMTTQAQLSLAAVTVLEVSGDTPARSKVLYQIYQNIADRTDADKLVQRRMKDHLLELDMQGIVEAEKQAAGSIGGPAYHFSLQVSTEATIDVLEDLDRFEDLDFRSISAQR